MLSSNSRNCFASHARAPLPQVSRGYTATPNSHIIARSRHLKAGQMCVLHHACPKTAGIHVYMRWGRANNESPNHQTQHDPKRGREKAAAASPIEGGSVGKDRTDMERDGRGGADATSCVHVYLFIQRYGYTAPQIDSSAAADAGGLLLCEARGQCSGVHQGLEALPEDAAVPLGRSRREAADLSRASRGGGGGLRHGPATPPRLQGSQLSRRGGGAKAEAASQVTTHGFGSAKWASDRPTLGKRFDRT